MVIQCTQCDTRFKVADEKVKPGGIKVRCSKCRHIFTVMPPEPEKPAPPPEPAQEDEIDFGDFNMKPVTEEQEGLAPEPDATEAVQPEATGSAGTALVEEPAVKGPVVEFDFGEEFATEGGPAEFDSGDDSSAEQSPSEFDFGNEVTPSEFEEDVSAEQGPSEFGFDEVPLPDQGPTEFDFEESPAEQEPAEFSFEEDAGSMDFSFDETDPFPEAAEDKWDSEKGAGAPEDFDFGDGADKGAEGEDFDLSKMTFGEEEPPADLSEEDFGKIPLEQAPEMEQIAAPPAQPKADTPSSAGVKGKKAFQPPPRRKTPFKGLLVFVLVLLVVLCGIAGYFFWQRGELDIAKIVEQITGQGGPSAVAGQIRLSDLSSSFVTNREAGQLFVIQGNAVNEFPETRSAIAVKGILYNGKGQALLQQTVFCGNPIAPEALRTMPFAKIEENMNNQFGDSLSNLNVGPGKAIPFTVVFKNLPPDIAEYTVETVDSKPGSKP